MRIHQLRYVGVGLGLVIVLAIIQVGFVVLQHDVEAQSVGDETLIVYLEEPDVTGTEPVHIYGQAQFVVNFTGLSVDQISHVGIVLLEDGSALEELPCVGSFLESGRWVGNCDTLGHPNGTYQVQIRATTTSDNGTVDAPVKTESGYPAIFGPIIIENTFLVKRPQTDGMQVSDSVPITFEASGELSAATAYITNRTNTVSKTIALNQSTSQQYTFSQWKGTWDSADVPNGTYDIRISIRTNEQIERSHIASRTVSLYNLICDPVETCTNWSVCDPTALMQTRTCTDGCGTTTTEQQPCSIETTDTTSTSESTTSTSSSIAVIQPSADSIVSGQTALRAAVSGSVLSVRFYYRRAGTSTDVSIGPGEPTAQDTTIWGRLWNTVDAPNGNYYVFARLTMNNGLVVMSQPPVPIMVDNDTGTQPSTTTINEEFGSTDSDGDLATDDEEIALGTDQYRPDTNGDGTTDSVELFGSDEAATDTTLNTYVSEGLLTDEQASAIRERLATSVFEQPTTRGVEAPEKLRVNTIENNFPSIGKTQLIISGIGPPNAYLTLFIYSNPIVVTTKTDEHGNFVYTLDSDLSDGQHEVYVTVTDEMGNIEEKSSVFTFFVRRAQAVTESEYLRGDVDVADSSSQQVSDYVRLVSIIILTIIAGLGIGWLVKQRAKTARS